MNVRCPECDAEIVLPKGSVPGEIISCSECGAELEIVKITTGGAEIKTAEIEGEDWGE
ncbi:MAG: lysine biosynthesis protein LysW [Candidatus Bathyarchaeia archaeon]